MRLTVYVGEQVHGLDIPEDLLTDGEEFFQKMDRDMDGGWQMSRKFVENPDQQQRCQIVADKLVDAMATGNQKMATLMGAYILKRMPEVSGVEVDMGGEIFNTEFITRGGERLETKPVSESEAREQAEHDVSKVYKVGRAYRFATKDPFTGAWIECPAIESEENAVQLRDEAVEQRFKNIMEQATGE